jgi:hypothetical protein
LKQDCNIFVAGDLVIDHTVFVHPQGDRATEPFQHAPSEAAHTVSRRLDTAGGAATAARAIAQLNRGKTYLWGLIGYSPWGSFRSILERAQALDDAASPIELRGASDETAAPMTTVSRLVVSQEPHDSGANIGAYSRQVRFTDFGGVHVPDFKRAALLYHLINIQRKFKDSKHKVNAVLIDDLNLGAMKERIVKKVAKFCDSEAIPLVIRAREGSTKYPSVNYRDIRAKSFVITGDEWAMKVGNGRDQNLQKMLAAAQVLSVEGAKDIARRCMFNFPQMDSWVILVGSNWIDHYILIERVPGSSLVEVSKILGHFQKLDSKNQQVGVSDVFAGALAVACANPDTYKNLQTCVIYAAEVANAYQESSWHRIPSPGFIGDHKAKPSRRDPALRRSAETVREVKSIVRFNCATHLFPAKEQIFFEDARTAIDGLYSSDKRTREELDTLVSRLKIGWDPGPGSGGQYHMILGAPSGSGKSAIASRLKEIADASGKFVSVISAKELDWKKPTKLLEKLAALRSNHVDPNADMFVIVDEAIKSLGQKYSLLRQNGVDFLGSATTSRIRFLFVDTFFLNVDDTANGYGPEFGRRCSRHILPGLDARPTDIPLVAAVFLRSHWALLFPRLPKLTSISFDISAIVGLVEYALEKNLNFGTLETECKKLATKISVQGSVGSLGWAMVAAELSLSEQPCESWSYRQLVIQFE